MLKTELINAIYERNDDISKKVIGEVLDNFETVVTDAVVSGDSINLTGFMKIYVADVPAKEGECAGKAYSSPAHKTVKVKVGKGLKDSVL